MNVNFVFKSTITRVLFGLLVLNLVNAEKKPFFCDKVANVSIRNLNNERCRIYFIRPKYAS